MNAKPTPQSLLQEIAQIQQLDRGTVSVLRQGPQGPYYNHQCYENGRNVSRYVAPEQVPDLKAALDGHHRVQELMAQYVQLLVEKTRAERAAGLKKKTPRRKSSWPGPGIQQLTAHFQAKHPKANGAGTGTAGAHRPLQVRQRPGGRALAASRRAQRRRLPAQTGRTTKGRETLQVQCLFGAFPLARDYYYHPGKRQGHYPADAALGLEVATRPPWPG